MNERGYFLNTSIGSNFLFLASLDTVCPLFCALCDLCSLDVEQYDSEAFHQKYQFLWDSFR